MRTRTLILALMIALSQTGCLSQKVAAVGLADAMKAFALEAKKGATESGAKIQEATIEVYVKTFAEGEGGATIPVAIPIGLSAKAGAEEYTKLTVKLDLTNVKKDEAFKPNIVNLK